MTGACEVCGLDRATVGTRLRFEDGRYVAVARCVDRAGCKSRVEAAGGVWDVGEVDAGRGPRGFSAAHRIVFAAAAAWRKRQANS